MSKHQDSKAAENACDCHMHFFDKSFPPAPTATLFPPDATITDYEAIKQGLGIRRHVIVQPSTYGTDNRLLLKSLRECGGTARGVAVINPGVSDLELEQLHAGGVTGIRFNLVQAGATSVEMLRPIAERIKALGWHIQVHMAPRDFIDQAGLLARLPVPIVIDHIARINSVPELAPRVLQSVKHLLLNSNAWLKLSGAYLASNDSAPDYSDLDESVCELVQLASHRLVWGSDWPHVTEKTKPDDARLFDLLLRWAPAESDRQAILVSNPQTLYRFD